MPGVGASSVRRQEIYRTSDQDEDDDLEPTTMAPLASQVIAAMMNDELLDAQARERRPSGFRVRETEPTLDDQATVPLTGALLQQIVNDFDARAAARAAPRPRPINATEVAIFVLSFALTASALLFVFYG
jgi:hypothetical protein